MITPGFVHERARGFLRWRRAIDSEQILLTHPPGGADKALLTESVQHWALGDLWPDLGCHLQEADTEGH